VFPLKILLFKSEALKVYENQLSFQYLITCICYPKFSWFTRHAYTILNCLKDGTSINEVLDRISYPLRLQRYYHYKEMEENAVREIHRISILFAPKTPHLPEPEPGIIEETGFLDDETLSQGCQQKKKHHRKHYNTKSLGPEREVLIDIVEAVILSHNSSNDTAAELPPIKDPFARRTQSIQTTVLQQAESFTRLSSNRQCT
jgi:hypothetical protein